MVEGLGKYIHINEILYSVGHWLANFIFSHCLYVKTYVPYYSDFALN